MREGGERPPPEPGCPQPGLRLHTYLITFGTYGARLHGDARGTVDRRRNGVGQPGEPPSSSRVLFERGLMRGAPVILTHEQMSMIESCAASVCERGGMSLHAVAAAPDHVHIVISARGDGATVRRLVKRWFSEVMSARWPLADGRRWWAEGGSVKPVLSSACRAAAIAYVGRQALAVLRAPRGANRAGDSPAREGGTA